MLGEVEAAVFDEWVAYRSIEPDPLERIAEILKLGFAGLCTLWSKGRVDPEKFDPKPRKDRPLGPGQAAALVRSRVNLE